MTTTERKMNKEQAIERVNRRAYRAWLKNVGKAVLTWIVWTAIFFIAGQIFIEAVMPGAVSLEAHVNGPRATFGQLLPAVGSLGLAFYLVGICLMDRTEKIMWAERQIVQIKFSYMANYNR